MLAHSDGSGASDLRSGLLMGLSERHGIIDAVELNLRRMRFESLDVHCVNVHTVHHVPD